MNRIGALLERIVSETVPDHPITVHHDEAAYRASRDPRRVSYLAEKRSLTVAEVARGPLLGQGSRARVRPVDLYMLETQEVRDALSAFVAEDAALLRRIAALEEAGVDVDDPRAANLRIHPVARHVTVAAGFDVETTYRSTRQDDGEVLREEDGVVMDNASTTIGGQRVVSQHIHRDGRITVTWMEIYGSVATSVRFVDGDQPMLLVEGLSMPETVLAAIPGMRLDAVVDHPLLRGCGETVTFARNRSTTGLPRIELGLESRMVRASDGKEVEQ